ncbi:CRISPR-associated helicase Cas3' [Thermococci archaeon]|nr:MAG: CRISPR-associated helicase Cas3' [Thermococci archaeon]
MDMRELFLRVTSFEPYDYQLRAWRKISEIMEEGGKVVIEVPTAGGKTEAAIFPYLYQIVSGDWKVPRLIYVLPTRSLVEKQAERIRKLLVKVLQLKGFDEETAKTMSRKMVQIEYGLTETYAFLGFILLTTWDAFLYGLAAHRTVGSRFTFPAGAIAESLVVFDEVQMYQDEILYMPRLIGLVIEKLSEANVPLVFMTATLPTELKRMLKIEDGEIVRVEESDTKKPMRGRVSVEVRKSSLEEFKGEIENVLKSGKRVLIIRNTVSSAVRAYKWVKKNFPNNSKVIVHSRFTQQDRKKKEQEIEDADIIVATQVVEAGLDLPNIGLVITDLAPLDALIQRVGRCARREGEVGKAIIVLPEMENVENERVVFGFNELKGKVLANLIKKDVKGIYSNVASDKDYGQVVELTVLYREKNKIKDMKFYAGSVKSEKVSEKLKKKKKDLYFIPYQTLPYDPLILLRSYDHAKSIEEYLLDIEKSRKALNEVYEEHYKNSIVPKEYYSAYIYFRELKLFSAPPEYELNARPELFAMLYPLESPKENEKVELNSDKIIRVSFSWLGSNWKRLEIGLKIVRDGDGYVIKKTSENKPKAYQIYVIDSDKYSSEVGIIPGAVQDDGREFPKGGKKKVSPNLRERPTITEFIRGDRR